MREVGDREGVGRSRIERGSRNEKGVERQRESGKEIDSRGGGRGFMSEGESVKEIEMSAKIFPIYFNDGMHLPITTVNLDRCC